MQAICRSIKRVFILDFVHVWGKFSDVEWKHGELRLSYGLRNVCTSLPKRSHPIWWSQQYVVLNYNELFNLKSKPNTRKLKDAFRSSLFYIGIGSLSCSLVLFYP